MLVKWRLFLSGIKQAACQPGYIMNLTNNQVKQSLLNRLRRIEGQVRGVEQMIEENRDCREIMQQLSSVRSAMQGATLSFMREYTRQCILNTKGQEPVHQEIIIDELIDLLGKVQD
jgi:CsoR family transcriptional regulator, copper-sensing transcriptional repressor